MFSGAYPHKINQKNQVTVPLKLRNTVNTDIHGEGFYLYCKNEGCGRIDMYTPLGWKKVVNAFREAIKDDPEYQMLMRTINYKTHHVDFDNSGRIILPSTLIKEAGLEHDVIFIGNTEKIEIWNKGIWEKSYTGSAEKFDMVREKLPKTIDL